MTDDPTVEYDKPLFPPEDVLDGETGNDATDQQLPFIVEEAKRMAEEAMNKYKDVTGNYLVRPDGTSVRLDEDGLPSRGVSIYGTHAPKITMKEKLIFLSVLADTGQVVLAARAIGRTRVGMYKLKKRDPEFDEAWQEANGIAVISMEDEAIRRAKKSSDLLMIFMLKALDPAKYGDRPKGSMPIDPKTGRPLTVTISWSDAPLEIAQDEKKPDHFSGRTIDAMPLMANMQTRQEESGE